MITDKYDVVRTLEVIEKLLGHVRHLPDRDKTALALSCGMLVTDIDEASEKVAQCISVVQDDLVEHQEYDLSEEISQAPQNECLEILKQILDENPSLLGDEESWNEVFEEYRPELVCFEREELGEDLEDVRQDLSDLSDKVLRLIPGGKS